MMFSKILNFLNNRARSLSVLTHVWMLMFVYTYPRAVAAGTFAEDMRDYDYESVLWAIVTGLLGGFARTLVSLASDKMIVDNVWKEAIKDALVSIIAGVSALIFLEALRAVYWPSLPSPARFAFILFAGASRVAFFGQINKFITNIMDSWSTKISQKLGSSDPMSIQAAAASASGPTPIQQAQAVVQAVVESQKVSNHIPVDPSLASRISSTVRTDALADSMNTMTAGQQAAAVLREEDGSRGMTPPGG
jgi:hypothetical protein